MLPNRLHMLRFPIGQAFLWQDGGALALIDAGRAESAAAIEGATRSLGLLPERLERVVLTHCHRDHVGARVNSPHAGGPGCWRTGWTRP